MELPSLVNNDEFIKILNERLTDNQKRMFTDSFSTYLQCDFNKDFVVDLDDRWRCLGYSKKDYATDAITKNFVENVDYSYDNFSRCQEEEQSHGNLKKIYLTVSAFMLLGVIAGTPEGREIRMYFIAVEESSLIFMKRQHEIQLQEKLELVSKLQDQIQDQIQDKEKIVKNFKSKKYEEVKKTGCNYTLQTDSLDFLKNGMSKYEDSKKRVKTHQSSNERHIEVLHEFPTSCPALLEKCVHYCLEIYRSDSGREFFGCKLDHIKNIVEIIGHVLDTCRSSFENISREELLEKILDKLQFTHDVNLKTTEYKDEVIQWIDMNVTYEKGSYLVMSELYIRWFSNVKVGNREKSKFRTDFEKCLSKFKANDSNFVVNMREGMYHPAVKTYKGWRDIRLTS